MSEKRASIANFFNFIEEEILIRIESIKMSIDNLQTELFDHVKRLRTDYETSLENEITEISKQLGTLDAADIATDCEQMKQTIHLCQDMIEELECSDMKIIHKLRTIAFEPSEWLPVEPELIGKISISRYVNLNYMKKIKPSIVDLSNSVRSLNRIYNLNDEYLIATSNDDSSLVIFNENFDEVRKIKEISNYKFKSPLSVCSDTENKYMYCCDFGNHKMVMFDVKTFDVIKTFGEYGCKVMIN
jgi:hypothetical protein